MTLVPASTHRRALLLCDDPVESHLLRSLLRSLPPGLRPEIVMGDSADAEIPAQSAQCQVCFLGFDYSGMTPARLLPRLRRVAPAIRVYGVLGSTNRHGDRAELARAMRAGLHDVLLLEELSVSALAAILDGEATLREPATGSLEPPAKQQMAGSGAWRITLATQQARFDEHTLETLGYAASDIGSGIGDWKSLIHPEDIDRLVAEVHRVLDGSAPPHPVGYRVRARDGAWLAVVSDDISVELDGDGAPLSISGTFYAALDERPRGTASLSSGTPARAEGTSEAPADALLEHCDTAITVYEPDAQGVFRITWCNAAAARLEDRPAGSMIGLGASQAAPPCDGFELDAALRRVHESGIPETREVMLLVRAEAARWRNYHIHRCGEGPRVISEVSDVSEQVGARNARRTQDEMAQFIARSFPLTTLVLDEQGRVMHCVSTANAVLGSAPEKIEDRRITELFGDVAGAQCLQQIAHTLNTGRLNQALYVVETATGKRWLECCSAPLRGRPGMPQRVVLSLQDATARSRELMEIRATRDLLREAMRRIPVALYLKDLDGRYLAISPAFEALLGIEESMLLGKTDVEVFPDELAISLHEADRKLVDTGQPFAEYRTVGHGERRGAHHCFFFPLHAADGSPCGTGGLWVAPGELPLAPPTSAAETAPRDHERRPPRQQEQIIEATATVISRVEAVLTEAGDYADVLGQLEQLVETTMQAQAMIHQLAGQADADRARALVSLRPLAEDIVELERILLPDSARFENELEVALPPAQCDPVVFHQIMLRGIRHARRALAPRGTLGIRLRRSSSGRRACLSCSDGFEGHYVELVIEDSTSRLDDAEIARLTAAPDPGAVRGGPLDDLAEMHVLAHSQGGHLQIHRNVPTGISVHVFFKAAEPNENDVTGNPQSTVARFPLGRMWQRKGPG